LFDIIKRNPNACFEVDRGYKTNTAELACDWSAQYQSVYGEGTISLVADDGEKSRALDIIMKRYGFEGAPVYSPESLSKVTVLRLDASLLTGKQRPA